MLISIPVVIDSAGRINIPALIRKAFNLKPGDMLTISATGTTELNKLEMTIEPPTSK